MYLLLHDLHLLIVPLGVGYLMAPAGVRKSALEWKRHGRICPSCGRDVQRCRCRE